MNRMRDNIEDRRGPVRWPINHPAELKLDGAACFIPCVISDISFTGIKISLRQKLPQEEPLRLRVALSEEFALDVDAWITWHRTIECYNIYGLYFTKIDDKGKNDIYEFIKKYYPDKIVSHWWDGIAENNGGGEHMDDRRIFQRFSIRLPLRFLDVYSGKEGTGETRDVNAKGVGFRTVNSVKINTPVEMWLDVPDRGEPLYTRGKVTWSSPEGLGEYKIGVALERADLMGLSRILRTV